MKARLCALVVQMAVLASGCGYALAGKAGSLPIPKGGRIGLPMLVNQSTTPELDRILTDAIRQELLARGRYTIVPETTSVDAVLTGTIMPITTNLSGITEARQASRYLITVTANVEFRLQPANTVHWSNAAFRASEEYEVPTGTGATDQTLVFQADRQALERLARTFARTLVASIFEG